MARSVSFSPYGGDTIKALQERQRMLAEQQQQILQPPAGGIRSPWQGASMVANSFVNNLNRRAAERQEADARQQLAQTIAGIDYSTGATPEQIGSIYQMDPEFGTRLMSDAMRLEQERAEYQRRRSDALSDYRTKAEIDREMNPPETFTPLTPEEEAQLGLDETGSYQRSSRSNKVSQVSPPRRAASGADRKALWDQQDQYINTQATIGKLQRASELLREGIHIGPLAGAKTYGGNAGLPGFDEQTAARTREYNNIMTGEAIKAMSQALKGATTDTEMARFISIMNDPTTPAVVKQREIDTMLAKAQSFQELQGARIGELGGETPTGAADTSAAGNEEAVLEEARDAIKRGADPELVRKRLADRGIDPGNL